MSTYNQSDESLCYCYRTKPVPSCLETLNIPQLTSGHTYVAVFTNAFGNEFRFQALAAGGLLAVDLENDAFPEQFLNPYSQYNLQVFNTLDLNTPVQFTFSGIFYECIVIEVNDRSPGVTSYTLA